MAEYIENVLAQTSKLDWAFPFERKGGFPLDKSALFSSLEDAQKYATGNANDERKLGGTSYVGQIISVYEPANEEAGTSASVNAYIITPARGLVKLAATTASGDVAGDIADLQGKVNGILEDIEALEEALKGVYTKDEVDDLIANAKDDRVDGLVEDVATLEENLGKEVERATAAEKALGERIDAIDFVDEDELADAIKDFVTDSELAEAIKDFATDTELANGLDAKVDKTTYATDKKALEDEDAAIREIAEEAKSLINDFLTGTDTDETVNKLKEIQAELEKLGDVVDLEAALALKADLSYVNEELAKKQNVIAENTYDAYGSAATAEQNAKDYADGLASNYDAAGSAEQAFEDAKDYADGLASNYDAAGAAEDVKDYADETFATKAYVGTIPEGKGADVIAYINKKAEETLAAAQGGSSETAASVKLALDNYKEENEPKFAKLEGIEAGAEVNVIEIVKVNGTALGVTDKAVNIDLSAYAKQADLNTVSEQANKGVADAAAANTAAGAAQATADEAKNAAAANAGRLDTAEGNINKNTGDITALTGRVSANEGAIAGLQGTVATKAAQADLEALQGIVGGHTAKLTTLETDTIPALQGAIEGKAANTALTAEIERATAAEQANANAIKAIADDYLKGADKTTLEQAIALKADTTALEAEVARATKKEGELADLIAGNTAVINSILGNEDEIDLNSIAELAAWITEHGTEAKGMTKAIEKNAEDIAANTKKIGEVEASIPGALATALADYKVKNVDNTTLQLSETGVASIKAVSTDLLTQGAAELVLNGGSAN